MANKKHLAILDKGVDTWNEWRKKNPEIQPDLSQAILCHLDDLSKANLSKANLHGSNLFGMSLREAILTNADLKRANLDSATLIKANLRGAILTDANLAEAWLMRANLTGVHLEWANLSGAEMEGTILRGAILYETILTNANLKGAKGLDSCNHKGSSSIDHRTILKSGPLPREFLLGCGVPKELIDSLQRIRAKIKYYSCFIAYGEPDCKFAEKLYKKLKAKEISCWLYSMDAKVGERIWIEIDEKRRRSEKFIVLCSGEALIRDGVLKEIEEQIDEDPDKLAPISLDNLWKEPGFRVERGKDLKPFLTERNYADFKNQSYNKAFARLLKGLELPKTSA